MKNKRLTLILVMFSIIVLLIVLSSAIFMLDQVKVVFLNGNPLNFNESQIIQSANFMFGENVLLLKKQRYINNLEKNNPYLKVVNLEVKFPNKIIINCVQRTSLFCVKSQTDKCYIVDKEFKILKILNNYEKENVEEILLTNIVVGSDYVEGDVITFLEEEKQLLNCISNGLLEWSDDYNFLKNNIVAINTRYQSDDKIKMVMIDDKEIFIKNCINNSSDKFNIAFSTYTNQIMQEKNYVYVYENIKKEIICVVG